MGQILLVVQILEADGLHHFVQQLRWMRKVGFNAPQLLLVPDVEGLRLLLAARNAHVRSSSWN